MQLTVKNLKGEKFPIEVEPSQTVAEIKTVIETAKSELPAANMKLIHSGKVLKDEDAIEKYNIKPNDFLVVMVTKPKKPAAAPAAAAPAPAATPKTPAPAPAAAVPGATAAETPAPAPAAQPPAAPARPSGDDFPAEVVANLTSMGFPEEEARACLRAANGNPDVAVEFLTNGIPEMAAPGAAQPPTPAAGSSGSGGEPLQALRSHPQFDDLRRLVQSNPQMLQQVLTQIGQQQPELLQEINANQARFLEMMNEPIEESAGAAPSGGSSSSPGAEGMPPLNMGAGGMADPGQMAQMMQDMDPQQLQAMAQMMGMSPEQVQAVGRMIGQLPPEQLQQYMAQAMGGGMGGSMGGGGMGGPQVLRLSEEEMAAVDRLTEMGFDRSEAAQAFIACDKNEALAANLLMDSAGQEGGAFGFGDDGGNGGGGSGGGGSGDSGGNSGDGGENMDDMYD